MLRIKKFVFNLSEEQHHFNSQVILDYSHCKVGVVNLDQIVGKYSLFRNCKQWAITLFFFKVFIKVHFIGLTHQKSTHSFCLHSYLKAMRKLSFFKQAVFFI